MVTGFQTQRSFCLCWVELSSCSSSSRSSFHSAVVPEIRARWTKHHVVARTIAGRQRSVRRTFSVRQRTPGGCTPWDSRSTPHCRPGSRWRAQRPSNSKLGYDGLFTAETTNDPFLDLAFPAVETTKPTLGNNLAIAFARSPYVTAVNAWQLQQASKGRFVLGLGTQVKGHIERRFGMPWESPGPKFREYVVALKELFALSAKVARRS